MLKKIQHPNSYTYSSSSDYSPEVFFLSHFRESILVKMHLGFYSSSGFRTISSGFKTFIKNGGRVQLIINHYLSENDKEILSGKYKNQDFESDDFLLNYLSDNGEYFFKCISYLLSQKRIEIKIVKPKNKSGIEHDKSGLFYDGENKVFYNGSSNWSQKALKENSESLSYYSSWSSDSKVGQTIKEFENNFDNIFNEKDKTKEYLDPSETKKLTDSIKEKFNIKDESELEIDYDTNNEILKKEIEQCVIKEYEILSKPKFPHPEPYPYQEEAYNSWIKNNKNGLFAMATGTGKTITSLLCLLREYEETGSYKSIILVPTVALMEQWSEEVKEFNFLNIYSSKNKEIRNFRRILNRGKDAIYVFVPTRHS
ncbi:MAG: DEAD/DEAH box helicase family protein [Verrucomicrobiales bacterium]